MPYGSALRPDDGSQISSAWARVTVGLVSFGRLGGGHRAKIACSSKASDADGGVSQQRPCAPPALVRDSRSALEVEAKPSCANESMDETRASPTDSAARLGLEVVSLVESVPQSLRSCVILESERLTDKDQHACDSGVGVFGRGANTGVRSISFSSGASIGT